MPYAPRKRPRDGIHRVVEGDTISSIAASYGITDWENRVWNAPENARLKTERVNPNTLAPGDEVFIPQLEQKQESRPVDAWHDFHVVRNKRFLRLKLHDENDQPLANRKYELMPGPMFRGTFVQQGQTTNPDGLVEEEIPHTMLEATLVLPDDNLRVKLMIGYLQPLPMSGPVEGPSLDVEGALGAVAGAAAGALGGGLGDLAGAATGAVSGVMGGALSGGASGGISVGSGGISGGFDGAASAAGGLAGAAKSGLSGAAKTALSAASAVAGPVGKVVAGLLGDAGFGGNEEDPNIYPSAQRLTSLGFDPGEPKDNRRTAQFSAALMEFQTWCKEKGAMPAGAGGMLGELTSPGGMLGGGGGALGAVAGAVAGPMLAAVGLTGQLDEATVSALKETHGC